MVYRSNNAFNKDYGFTINAQDVLVSVGEVNAFLASLPPNLFNSIDFKTTGSMIGAVLCGYLVGNLEHAMVNPIEKGHPDIIPASALGSAEAVLRNYPKGIEIKGTIGNTSTGANLRAGVPRIDYLTGITWQAHHREVNHLLGVVWDFANETKLFNFPAITGVFFSENFSCDDWGKISGTTGRNTKVCAILKTGRNKMGLGWVLIYDHPKYIQKYSQFLGIAPLDQA